MLTDTEEEAIQAHREEIKKWIIDHDLQIDLDHVRVKLAFTSIRNKKLAWILVHYKIVKL